MLLLLLCIGVVMCLVFSVRVQCYVFSVFAIDIDNGIAIEVASVSVLFIVLFSCCIVMCIGVGIRAGIVIW